MLGDMTEIRICVQPHKTILDKLFEECVAGHYSNLTIKEEYFMLEKLIAKRDDYVAELNRLKNINLEEIINNRLELVKEEIREEAKAELNEKLEVINSKVSDYNSVIADLEAQAVAEIGETNEPTESNASENVEE